MKMKRTTRGFTLIEVLVAVVIVSLGILGIASTLLTATRSSVSNYLKQQAIQDAYDMVDRMRANRSTAIGTTASVNPYIFAEAVGTVPSATPPTPYCTASGCSGTQMATVDVWQWQTLVSQNLPKGAGTVTVVPGASGTAPVVITVQVQWIDTPAQTTFNAAIPATPATYTVVTAL